MRINPLQIGFSIIMGWVIVFVSYYVIQSIINPRGEEMFWVVFLLGLSLIGLSLIKKEKMISTNRAKTLLQIGVVVTIIWVMIFIQSEGPYNLGLPKPYITVGYTPDGVSIVTPLIIILFLFFPVLGLILLVLGIVLNRIKKS
jgi:formate hydrogenlyase subunit 3/multisubunit Na+/H+ antiporter MnhD subunit